MALYMHIYMLGSPGLLNYSFGFAFVVFIGMNTYTEASRYDEGVIKKNATPHFVILVSILMCIFGEQPWPLLFNHSIHSYSANFVNCTYLYGAW